MRYFSICSGVEAATQAWSRLGWQAAGFSEIEPFPCAVLHHHYSCGRPKYMPSPGAADTDQERRRRAAAVKAVSDLPERGNGTPNMGDFTQITDEDIENHGPIDLIVGGTPCQDYSVAGQGAGLDGDRGHLTLEFARLARRWRPQWLVWENVPGVFTTNRGRDFGAVLAGFAGYGDSEEFSVPKGGWRNAGVAPAAGPHGYGIAWRVLDAQFVRVDGQPFAVPQRRRRVFVVGYFGDWRRAAAVLLEFESLRGDSAPRRETGKAAPTIPSRGSAGGCLGTDFDCDGGLVAKSLLAKSNSSHDESKETYVAHTLRGAGFDASEDGTGRGTPIIPVGFHGSQDLDVSGDASENVSPTLRAGGHAASHANAGVTPAIAIQERAVSENPDAGPQAVAFKPSYARTDSGAPSDVAHALTSQTRFGDSAQCIAVFDPNQVTSPHNRSKPTAELCQTLPAAPNAPVCYGRMAVRRLTPRECERLQGIADDFTRIPWRGKAPDLCPDGPRYKAIGNSKPVNVVEWLGRRIDLVSKLN